MVYTRPALPERLGQVEAFCSSARFLYGRDAFAELTSARQELLRMREAIRDHIDGDTSERVHSTLNDYARSTLLPPQWTATDQPLVSASGDARVGEVGFGGGELGHQPGGVRGEYVSGMGEPNTATVWFG